MSADIWKDGTRTLPFWAFGDAYTIVPGRHIGIDYAPVPAGEPWDVAALVEADVVASVQTSAIGRVVVTDTRRPTRRYISYCHNYYGDPARVGTHLARAGRVARLALAWESPGSAWGGVHSHTVVHDNPVGAYTRCGDTYYDPQVEIDAYLATSASLDAHPLPTQKTVQEDDMAGLIQHKDRGIALIAPGYFKAVTPEELPIAVSRYGWPKIYDDSQVGAREFDLDVSLAVNGAGGDQQVRSELERSRDAVLKAINGMRGSV